MVESAGAWFLRSGIQAAHGGVARYYRSDLGRNARVSTEITGYAVSAFLYFHRRAGAPEYAEAALRAASFLAGPAWDREAEIFPFECPGADEPAQPPLAYFFDSGIVVRGLLSAWRFAKAPELLERAVAAGHSMLRDFSSPEAFHPILDLPGKRPLPYAARWSASPGCYQLKSAMAWRDLGAATGDRSFLDAYEIALARCLSNAEEFLPGEAQPEKVMDRLHAFAYFLEGLLPALRRPECARACRLGLERAASYLREIEPVFARSDVYAQLLRARLYADALGAAPLDSAAAAREAREAARFQIDAPDPRERGGFGFGRKDGRMLPFVNPVSTAFCAQALAMWSDRQRGAFEPRLEDLI